MRWPVLNRPGVGTLLLGACLGLLASQSRANTISYTVTDSGSDGPLAATVSFTTVSAGTLNGKAYGGGLEVSVTNDLSGSNALNLSQGQAVSYLTFSLGGSYSASEFTVLSGDSFTYTGQSSWTAADGSAFTDAPSISDPSAIDHWGFATGSKIGISLEAAGQQAPGGQPYDMILPSTGSAQTGGFGNFNPYLLGTAEFFITVNGMDSTTILSQDVISNVVVGFGTQPDTTVPSSYVPATTTPIPASLSGGVVILCGLCVFKLFRSRSAMAK